MWLPLLAARRARMTDDTSGARTFDGLSLIVTEIPWQSFFDPISSSGNRACSIFKPP
jgi:hypothetical protein